MGRRTAFWATLAVAGGLLPAPALAQAAATATERSFTAANDLVVKVRQVAPGAQPSDVQIICYFRHKPEGDKVIEALVDFDQKAGGTIKALRDRGEFVGDERETLLFTPPSSGGLKARSILLVGLGTEDALTLDTMGRIGMTALREAVQLKAASVSYASAIKDQGVDKLDAGEVAEAVVKNVILAYDTETRLQRQGRAPRFTVREWVYEAGPAFYASTVEHVQQAVASANAAVAQRSAAPYGTK